MNGLTDHNGLGLTGGFIYTVLSSGRRGFVVFTGPEDGSEPFRPVRGGDRRVRFGYLNADGSEPDPLTAEFDYAIPSDLSPSGVLPSAVSDEDEEEFEDDCPHDRTVEAETGEPYDRVCADCDSRIYLSDNDAAYYVTSVDGTTTYDGPFDTWDAANTRAEEIESANHGLIVTDIQHKAR